MPSIDEGYIYFFCYIYYIFYIFLPFKKKDDPGHI